MIIIKCANCNICERYKLSNLCLKCIAKVKRDRYKIDRLNPDFMKRQRLKSKKYYETHKVQIDAKNQTPKAKAYKKQFYTLYYKKHKKDLQAYGRRYYQDNKERQAMLHKKYFEMNKDKYIEYHKRYAKQKKIKKI